MICRSKISIMKNNHISLTALATSTLLLVQAVSCTPAPTQKGERKTRHELFVKPEVTSIPYRIPAIATASNGDLIAVVDYRFSREDIGFGDNGRIDLHARIGKNNGKRWGEIFTLAEGRGGEATSVMEVGYGDPAIVADRESDRVMVISCAGNVPYIQGTRNNHLLMTRFYSNDNGQTWSEPEDISEHIYAQFDHSTLGHARSMFVASGRIMQSRTVKVGEYYRLYAAVLVTLENGDWRNFVLYSDDFGQRWGVLGGVNQTAINVRSDEAKVEELPDGRVLISSRAQGGRNFNIFAYSDVAAAEGKWGELAFSGAENRGVESKDNACNGEIMILPAEDIQTGEKVHLMLQSVPFGPDRWNVGIYFKALRSPADYATADAIARDWERGYQATTLESAYSTMCWLKNNRLGFLYEEGTYNAWEGGGYTIVYDSYSLEEITSDRFRYRK